MNDVKKTAFKTAYNATRVVKKNHFDNAVNAYGAGARGYVAFVSASLPKSTKFSDSPLNKPVSWLTAARLKLNDKLSKFI